MRTLGLVSRGSLQPRALRDRRRTVPAAVLVPHPVASAALRAPGAVWRPRVWALLAGEYARYLLARAGLSGLAWPRREARD